jgi:hypothetical protein
MKALISPSEKRNIHVDSETNKDAFRIAEVKPNDGDFDVAPPLFWKECPDECEPDLWYYDPETEDFIIEYIPEIESELETITEDEIEQILSELENDE